MTRFSHQGPPCCVSNTLPCRNELHSSEYRHSSDYSRDPQSLSLRSTPPTKYGTMSPLNARFPRVGRAVLRQQHPMRTNELQSSEYRRSRDRRASGGGGRCNRPTHTRAMTPQRSSQRLTRIPLHTLTHPLRTPYVFHSTIYTLFLDNTVHSCLFVVYSGPFQLCISYLPRRDRRAYYTNLSILLYSLYYNTLYIILSYFSQKEYSNNIIISQRYTRNILEITQSFPRKFKKLPSILSFLQYF